MLYYFSIIYFIIISIVAIVFTLYDKTAAKKKKWRISENSLLFVSAIGGSVAMFLSMILIRHKTKKAKFMIGIPLIILVQLGILIFVLVNL